MSSRGTSEKNVKKTTRNTRSGFDDAALERAPRDARSADKDNITRSNAFPTNGRRQENINKNYL